MLIRLRRKNPFASWLIHHALDNVDVANWGEEGDLCGTETAGEWHTWAGGGTNYGDSTIHDIAVKTIEGATEPFRSRFSSMGR